MSILTAAEAGVLTVLVTNPFWEVNLRQVSVEWCVPVVWLRTGELLTATHGHSATGRENECERGHKRTRRREGEKERERTGLAGSERESKRERDKEKD